MLHPRSPLPDHWNPARPLDAAAPVTPVTHWKLARATRGAVCFAALRTAGVRFRRLADPEETPACYIRDRLSMDAIGDVAIAPLDTRCATALRLALWTRQGLVPAAQDILGSGLARLHHLESYSCRVIRTPGGAGGRMSTHATADAVDIAGMTLEDGRRVVLADHWGQGAEGRFLEAALDSACAWFVTALGPEFNSLHADHFHLQARGWGLCR